MTTNIMEWKTLINNSTFQKSTFLEWVEVGEHPLRLSTVDRIPRRVLGSQPSTGRSSPVSTPATLLEPLSAALEGLDPLTQFAIQDVDPLSKIAAEMTVTDDTNNSNKKYKERKTSLEIEPWSARKAFILAKFTTSEKLSIVTSFLSEGEKVVVKAQSNIVDKVQHRLEQLDYFEEGTQRRLDLSQAEFMGRIEQLNKELVSAWHSEQRVKALKIAIQCAKLLADSDVLRFYPSKFVLITEILDIFGELVYERLRTKADYYRPGSKVPTALPEDFTPEMVPESAKETCRNWFYKIASIRELVPRLYVEMAILKSYSFLTSSEYSAALLRLTHMIRGIGHPLVSVYARCYLCRVGISVTAPGTDSHYLMENFYDFLDTYEQLFNRSVNEELMIQKMEVSAYLTLYTPALDFILQAVACKAPESLLVEILDRCRQHNNSSLLLNAIMAAFKPSYISVRSLQFLDLIGQSTEQDFPPYLLLRTLGLCISICPPPTEHRRQVINVVWNTLTNIKNPEQYITCVEVWIQFVVQYFTSREVNAILGDIIEHMSPNRAYEQYYQQLKAVIDKIISCTQDFEGLLALDNFMPLVDLFQQETVRVEVCKSILISCSVAHHTSDPVITNALMFLCGVLHDSISALTVEDEIRQIGELLCNVVRRVDYGRDFEHQLNFYVEARGAFSNLDTVLAQLVQCVNTLSVNTRRIVKGHHTRKTGSFVRACAAFCFITIPSIDSVRTRLELYLLSGQVALFNSCLGQADACFKAALGIIPELSSPNGKFRGSEAFLTSYVKSFLSTLLVVPDSPDRGVLSLTRVLLNTLQSFEWESENGNLIQLYISVLDMLSAMAQENYSYHVDKVESNDALYGSDQKFIAEIDKMCSLILGQLLSQLKQLGSCRKQSTLAIELMVKISIRSNLDNNTAFTLALNLWQLCLKNGNEDFKYMMRIRDYLSRRSKTTNNKALQQLISKLKVS